MTYTVYGWAVSLDVNGVHYLYNADLDAWLKVPTTSVHDAWAKPLPDTELLTPQGLEHLIHHGARVAVHV